MDQSISYYKFERKTRRWTLKYAFYVIEVMINNCFVKYKLANSKISRIEYILEAMDIIYNQKDLEQSVCSVASSVDTSKILRKNKKIGHYIELS